MTQPDPFCPVCQRIVGVDCPGHSDVPEHSLSPRRESVRTKTGDSGDTPLSPPKPPRGQRKAPQRGHGDTNTPKPAPRKTSWTAAELLAAHFPEPRWAVPGLIGEGVTLLAGPPKAGKSWLALNLCVAVSAGGKALSSIDVQAGPCLYLALEDTGRRLKDRLSKVLGPSPAPPGLIIATECPPLAEGGLTLISKWIENHQAPRLVMIDVFERIRGQARQGESAYTADYTAVREVKSLADEHQVGIVLIHHVRKVGAADFISEVSGTLGLAGAADTVAVLKRSRGELDGVLAVTGRDVEENEYALRFDTGLGTWQMLGLASELVASDTRQKILAFVAEHVSARPAEVALGTGLDKELTKKTMQRMRYDGQLDTEGNGNYFIPARVPVGVPLSPEAPNPS